MDHTGDECVPRQVSLLEAHMNQPARVALLQRRDGYDPDARGRRRAARELPAAARPSSRRCSPARRCSRCSTPDELDALARTARPLTLGPMERIIVQGQEGDSLFVVADGEVEVAAARATTAPTCASARWRNGAVLGEMSLLTGEPRSATVRARRRRARLRGRPRQYEPILAARPELVDILAKLMVNRIDERRTRLDARRGRARARRDRQPDPPGIHDSGSDA